MNQMGFSFTKHFKKEHGGSLQKGKRKSARPLSAKYPHHLVLKSSHSAFFNASLRVLEKLIYAQAAKYRIKIYGLSLNWSHLHAVVQFPDRASYKAFIRTLTAEIVKLLSKLKGQAWGLIPRQVRPRRRPGKNKSRLPEEGSSEGPARFGGLPKAWYETPPSKKRRPALKY